MMTDGKDKDILIIPDVHGRTFWREAVKSRDWARIVFLGDYLDPYGREGISPEMAFAELGNIVAFKKENPERVVLLLGNHDLGYLDGDVCECRHDYYGEERNMRFILENIGLFDLFFETVVAGRKVLFSHAGVRQSWVDANRSLFRGNGFSAGLVNSMFRDPESWDGLMPALSQLSFYRGGSDYAGSPVWTDVNEFIDNGDLLSGYLQLFGHTLHSGGPVCIRTEETEGWCLDCREAFVLSADGRIGNVAGRFYGTGQDDMPYYCISVALSK